MLFALTNVLKCSGVSGAGTRTVASNLPKHLSTCSDEPTFPICVFISWSDTSLRWWVWPCFFCENVGSSLKIEPAQCTHKLSLLIVVRCSSLREFCCGFRSGNLLWSWGTDRNRSSLSSFCPLRDGQCKIRVDYNRSTLKQTCRSTEHSPPQQQLTFQLTLRFSLTSK